MPVKMVKDNGVANQTNKISVIFPCFGRYEIVEPWVNETQKALFPVKDKINLIVVLDGNHWENTPLIQVLNVVFPHLVILAVTPECSLPSILFNAGLEKVVTPYVTFVWPGCGVVTQDIVKFVQVAESGRIAQKVYYLSNKTLNQSPMTVNKVVLYARCLSAKMFELNNFLVSQDVFKEIGFFDSSKLIQKEFDWEFEVRLARHYHFVKLGAAEGLQSLGFDEYPFHECFNISKDIAHRYLLRGKRLFDSKRLEEISPDESDFLNDLPLSERIYVSRAAKIETHSNDTENASFTCDNRHYKITIVSGYWDFPHNQICFLNYLDKLYGKGFATYKMLLDSFDSANNLNGSDLVIFSRCRDPKVLNLIQYCRANQIAALYMLDDNWLQVAKDWPEHYGKLFVPGNPNFDTFLEAIKSCDAVLVYNKYLEEDLKPYARRVIRIPTNIDLDLFQPLSERESDHLLIGYSGSLRYDDEAFLALAEVAAENPDVKVLILGHITAKQNELFKNLPIIQMEYNMYFDYYKQLMSLRPLILLAPLDASRSSMSKCPNKYLEIAAAGSVGIYSDIYPYNELIEDGTNGFLVGTRKEDWKQKILFLLNHRNLLPKIRENSRRHIETNFTTEVVMPRFCRVVDSLIRGEQL